MNKRHEQRPHELEIVDLRAKLDNANEEIAQLRKDKTELVTMNTELLAKVIKLLAMNETLEIGVGEYALKQSTAHNETLKEAVHYSGVVAQIVTEKRGGAAKTKAKTDAKWQKNWGKQNERYAKLMGQDGMIRKLAIDSIMREWRSRGIDLNRRALRYNVPKRTHK
jgi:hypothetical protein